MLVKDRNRDTAWYSMLDGEWPAVRGDAAEGKGFSPEPVDLAGARRGRCQQKNCVLLEEPARLRLQTFDSFAASVTAQAPLASRLAGRNTETDAEPIYRQAARELLSELAGPESDDAAPVRAALRRLLLHVDNDWPRLERLLTGMLSRRDQWLRHFGGGEPDADARAALEAALQSVIAAALQAVRAAIPAELDAPLAELARYAAANRGEKSHPHLAAGQDLASLPGAELASLPTWLCLAAMFLTAKDESLKSVTARQGFPAASGGAAAKAPEGGARTPACLGSGSGSGRSGGCAPTCGSSRPRAGSTFTPTAGSTGRPRAACSSPRHT